MTTMELKDLKTVPDIIYEYPKLVKEGQLPLIIDNGSYHCRVGWSNTNEPALIFRNLIAKPRKERGKKDGELQIGNDITNIEAVRFQLKTQFDRNVVVHYEVQEQILDYTFTHLGIDTEGSVNHPILITEPFLNPNFSRNLMSELLFECYSIPSLSYGIDSVFSFQQNNPNIKTTGLIISFGYQTTHVIPIIDGQIDVAKSRRINIGGFHIINFLHRLLQLKYPSHYASITPSRAEELLHEHTFIATHYQEDLHKWSDADFYESNVHRIQLPYSITVSTPALTADQQKERRKELAKRLIEINARKREEKLAEDEEQLNQLLAVEELLEEGEVEEFQQALESYELSNALDLKKTIAQLQSRIEKTRQKIVAANTADDTCLEEQKSKPTKQHLKPKDEEDFSSWIAGIKSKRQEILDRRNARRQRRQDMAKRRTAAAQERMRLISQLARKEKRDDNFGMRDEDWDVYKVINKEGGESDSDEEQKLMDLEEVLRLHDPEFCENVGLTEPLNSNPAEINQLHVGIERIRAVEILFQPSMIGSIEAGLAEVIEFILKKYPEEVQARLVNNVFLTGGCAALPQMIDRIKKELMEMRPFESKFRVSIASKTSLDSWLGAKKFANSSEFEKSLITRQEYFDKGGEYFKEHSASNPYFPSPAPIPQVVALPDNEVLVPDIAEVVDV